MEMSGQLHTPITLPPKGKKFKFLHPDTCMCAQVQIYINNFTLIKHEFSHRCVHKKLWSFTEEIRLLILKYQKDGNVLGF